MPNQVQIDARRSIKGGWDKATLAEWGVPWPPPAGWREKLIAESRGGDITLDDGTYCTECLCADSADCMKVGTCERRDMAKEIRSPRCRCPSERVRSILVEGGTCPMGGCAYGGDF